MQKSSLLLNAQQIWHKIYIRKKYVIGKISWMVNLSQILTC
ncbi:hypothetical protein U5B43_05320 [Campylobacter sp. 9BO]